MHRSIDYVLFMGISDVRGANWPSIRRADWSNIRIFWPDMIGANWPHLTGLISYSADWQLICQGEVTSELTLDNLVSSVSSIC